MAYGLFFCFALRPTVYGYGVRPARTAYGVRPTAFFSPTAYAFPLFYVLHR